LIFGVNIVVKKHYGKIIKIMHGYTLNLKALIKVSKVSFHMKYLDLHFKENLIIHTSFLQKTNPKSPHLLGLRASK
jgi:hypothetical protein